MAKNLMEIEQILREGKTGEAHHHLKILLEKEPDNAEAWYLMGGILRREQQWGEAINALSKAKFLNPEGPAAHAIDYIYEILKFKHNDLLNP